MNGLSICSSYARLGLIHDLNPSAPGGSEQVLVPRNGEEEMAVDHPEQVVEPSSSSKRLPAGHGRIIRDVSGNVIGVELPEEDEGEAGDEVEETMDDLEPEADGSVMGRWAASLGQHNEVAGEKPAGLLEGEFASMLGVKASGFVSRSPSAILRVRCFVRCPTNAPFPLALEGIASKKHMDSNTLSVAQSSTGPNKRHAATGEVAYLSRLTSKYGDDVERMATDRRLNSEQRTAGQLRRALKNAGLWGK